MKEVKADDQNLVNAFTLGKGCLALVDQSESELSTPHTKSNYRQLGGGRNVYYMVCYVRYAILEVRQAFMTGSLTRDGP